MMDNLRRNVDDKTNYINYYNINETSNSRHDGDRVQAQDEKEMTAESAVSEEGHKMDRTKMKGLNKLDTVTTVPQLQQKFNKFNIIDEAAITTNTTTTTTTTFRTTTCVAAAKTSTTTTSSSSHHQQSEQKQQQQQNTALAKFNRIIDNTVPVINAYNNYQQHIAETLAKSSQQQHPQHYHQKQQQQQYVEMPLLSDSLKRRLAQNQHHHQYITDPIVNNSKINFSSATVSATAAAMALTTSSKANATAVATKISSSSLQQEQETFAIASLDKDDEEQLKRNDVHYLLKQLNSFSDIEEIEIVDMKQKQRLQQQKQQLQEKLINKEKNFIKNQQQTMTFNEYQHVERIKQHEDIAETKFITNKSVTQAIQQEYILDTQAEQHIAGNSLETVVVGQNMYTNAESKQHYEISTTSPTATSLVICSPSSQSHKGIRRYASQDEHSAAASYQRPHPTPHHQHYHHHHYHPHQQHLHMPHEHYSEGFILDSAAANAASGDPLTLQQFVDDYIFQSCHYLEANNFVANYRTAMVESSSHEFRPSTTTTTTRTSNEEFYEEEETGYVEDHSSAHSFELHETEPPTVICKAPAPNPTPLPASKMKHQQSQQQQMFTMETRLCSSGVQTDLTASSLAQSFSLSSSLSSSEKNKRKQPIFKCCYTPLDRWREKRSQQQQSQTQKRTKSATTTTAAATTTTSIINTAEQKQQGQQQHQQIITKNTSVAVVGGTSSNAGGAGCTSATTSPITTTIVDTNTSSSSSSLLVVQPQHYHHQQYQSLRKNKNAPYAV